MSGIMTKAHTVVPGYVHYQTKVKIVSIAPIHTSSKKKLLFTCEDKTTLLVEFDQLVPFIPDKEE